MYVPGTINVYLYLMTIIRLLPRILCIVNRYVYTIE